MKLTIRQGLIGSAIGLLLAGLLTLWGLGPKVAAGSLPLSVKDISDSVSYPDLPLSREASVPDVLALMLKSHTTWESLSASSVSTYMPESAEKVVSVNSGMFTNDGRGYVDLQLGSVQSLMYMVDGKTTTIEDRTKKKYTQFPAPEFGNELRSGPPAPPPDSAKFVIPHPLARTIPGDLVFYVFSTGLAQAMHNEDVKILSEEKLLGRTAVALEWKLYREKEPYEIRKFWVDSETGIVLKAQSLNAETDFKQVVDEFEIVSIDFVATIPASKFVFTPDAGVRFTELVNFYTGD